MKKLIISAICSTLAVSGFAQGSVDFANGGTSAVVFWTNAVASRATSSTILNQGTALGGGPAAAANTSTGVIDLGFEWSTSAFTTIAGGTFVTEQQMASGTPGIIAGTAVQTISGTSQNEVIFIQVFAWDDTYGDTQVGLEDALANNLYFGAASAGNANTTYGLIGAAIQTTAGLGATTGPGVPIFGTVGGQQFEKTVLLAPVPEPATLALGGLGAAALLLFRRRK